MRKIPTSCPSASQTRAIKRHVFSHLFLNAFSPHNFIRRAQITSPPRVGPLRSPVVSRAVNGRGSRSGVGDFKAGKQASKGRDRIALDPIKPPPSASPFPLCLSSPLLADQEKKFVKSSMSLSCNVDGAQDSSWSLRLTGCSSGVAVTVAVAVAARLDSLPWVQACAVMGMARRG
jgi:hypothetical protein